jgi:methyl-accepting chemotaxis protein
VTDIVAEIASASAEQSTGIDQVNGAIADMDASTQHNAALVEESAAAATSLKDQAAKLAEVVSLFNIGGQAPAAARAPARTTARTASIQAAPARKLAAPARVAQASTVKRGRAAATADDGWETF